MVIKYISFRLGCRKKVEPGSERNWKRGIDFIITFAFELIIWAVSEDKKEEMMDTIADYVGKYKAGGDEHIDCYILLIMTAGKQFFAYVSSICN